MCGLTCFGRACLARWAEGWCFGAEALPKATGRPVSGSIANVAEAGEAVRCCGCVAVRTEVKLDGRGEVRSDQPEATWPPPHRSLINPNTHSHTALNLAQQVSVASNQLRPFTIATKPAQSDPCLPPIMSSAESQPGLSIDDFAAANRRAQIDGV